VLYLDHAATTPVRRAPLEAAWPWLTSEFGNPSSTHELGLRAASALADARARVAAWLECRASEVVFTSGGSEGDNLCVVGLALANPRGRHLISARSEHEAVLGALEFLERVHGFEVSWLPLSPTGEISLDDLRATLRPDTTLVSLMLANNEVGTVHPIAAVSAMAHEVGALVHTDAVQAAGWLDARITTLGVDALTLSGHKLGAPKGSGAVFIRGRLVVEPLIHGGGQEFDRRSGTENVAWAVALATALETLPDPLVASAPIAQLRDSFISQVVSDNPHALVTGAREARHPGIASFCFPGTHGETLLLELEREGVIVSSGSACAAGSTDPSHVLLTLGVDPDVAQTSVRFSFPHDVTADDLTQAARAMSASLRRANQGFHGGS
jgi:cysteine desulfurase